MQAYVNTHKIARRHARTFRCLPACVPMPAHAGTSTCTCTPFMTYKIPSPETIGTGAGAWLGSQFRKFSETWLYPAMHVYWYTCTTSHTRVCNACTYHNMHACVHMHVHTDACLRTHAWLRTLVNGWQAKLRQGCLGGHEVERGSQDGCSQGLVQWLWGSMEGCTQEHARGEECA